jgi:hypothetical protein
MIFKERESFPRASKKQIKKSLLRKAYLPITIYSQGSYHSKSWIKNYTNLVSQRLS